MIIPEGIKIYGDINFRDKKCPKEDAELATFFNQLKKKHPELAKVALHIKNEGVRTAKQAEKEKIKGALLKGAVDIIIPPIGFASEVKRTDHTLSKIDDEQVEYLTINQNLGGFSCICLGYKAVFEALDDCLYLSNPQ